LIVGPGKRNGNSVRFPQIILDLAVITFLLFLLGRPGHNLWESVPRMFVVDHDL
jgi:hypothetical protein